MEHSFWHDRWKANELGFHEADGNALLASHFGTLGKPEGARVFVPLCGKTRDIGWLLAQGCRVVGTELSEIAVRDLFKDLGLSPEKSEVGELNRYAGPSIEVFVGDHFTLTADVLGTVDAIYDRAAFVALPSKMRQRYSASLKALAPGVPQLLITFEYDQSVMPGPPHSISTEEVGAHYADAFDIEMLEVKDVAGKLKGKVEATETIWHLTPK
ncbi:MAG: thiopurine S-methyltransferase [Pseudomonadota bacterium]